MENRLVYIVSATDRFVLQTKRFVTKYEVGLVNDLPGTPWEKFDDKSYINLGTVAAAIVGHYEISIDISHSTELQIVTGELEPDTSATIRFEKIPGKEQEHLLMRPLDIDELRELYKEIAAISK